MKEKLTENLGIKLLSIPLAFLIWIFIINIDDPAITRAFSNIPIQFLNEDAISSLGMVYDVKEGNTVTVTVRGKRSILDKIKYTDLQVTADLTQMTPFNKIELVASCPRFDYANLEFATKPKMLTIKMENKETKQVKINVEQQGEAGSGFSVGSVEAKPNLIEVSGARSVVNKIAEARVVVNINNATESFQEKQLIPKVYNEDGEEIDSSRLKFSSVSINVKVNIQRTKTVPVEVNLKGEASKGYSIIKTDFEPSQIKITGEDSVLEKISSIPIVIDVENVKDNIEKEIDLKEYLPDGVTIVGNMTSIAVKVTVEKLATKEITFTTSDIDTINVPDGMKVLYSNSDRVYKVKVMGLEDVINKLTPAKLGAYIDLNNLGSGKHTVSVKFVETDAFEFVDTPTVSIQLTEEEDTPPASEPNSPSTEPTEPETPVDEEDTNTGNEDVENGTEDNLDDGTDDEELDNTQPNEEEIEQ